VERRQERPVELDREDLRARLGQGQRDRAEPGPDVDRADARSRAGVGRDRPGEVRVGEEVLPQGLGRPDAVAGGELPDLPKAETGATS
jgi:hypothetical protein